MSIPLNVKACRKCFKDAGQAWPTGVVVNCRKSGLPLMASHVEPHDCPLNKFKVRGLGDVIARATAAIGIEPCGGCEARRAMLNKLLPARGA